MEVRNPSDNLFKARNVSQEKREHKTFCVPFQGFTDPQVEKTYFLKHG